MYEFLLFLCENIVTDTIPIHCKVENILKGGLDLIPSPSPSMKIQIMGGKVGLRCKGKALLGVVNKLFGQKIC